MDDNEDQPETNYDRPVPSILTAKRSTVGLIRRRDPKTGDWRYHVSMSRAQIDDHAKSLFLAEYMKHGRMGIASAAAGFSSKSMRQAMDADPEFAEAVLLAEEAYRDKLIRHHQDLIFNGTERKTYDRAGNVISTEIQYPQRLIELELKKHDPGYREKVEQTIHVKRGVMVAPAEMQSVDDWEKRYSQAKDVTPTNPSPLPLGDHRDEDGDDGDVF